MVKRTVKKLVNGTSTQDGAGVKLRRVISKPDVYEFDPFLLLDAFDSYNSDDYIKGFPWHPHRGIETITYLIEGTIEHGDSIGNKGTIKNGDCQWMTAGGGILHQEMPKASKHMFGVQLWLNLKSDDKWATPKYRDLKSDDIPKHVDAHGNSIAILSGQFNHIEGALKPDYVQMTFLDCNIKPHQNFGIDTLLEDNAFIYVLTGQGHIENTLIEKGDAALLTKGDQVVFKSLTEETRFLYISGKSLKEPIAWGGPIVMNTKEELNQAFEDLEKGTFINK